MTPNQITIARVAAAFAAVAFFTCFSHSLAADFVAVLLTVAAIALDGLDGHIARTRGLASPLGAQLDILGDRIEQDFGRSIGQLDPIVAPVPSQLEASDFGDMVRRELVHENDMGPTGQKSPVESRIVD